MTRTLLQNLHAIKGIDAVADAFAGTVSSDVVRADNYESILFVVHKGVGTTGTSTITVEACDDVVPTTTAAVPFFYRTVTSGDVPSALTKATTSGFTTTAGSSQLYLVEVRVGDLASTGYNFVRLKATEVVDAAVLGGILILAGNPRNAQPIPATAIS